MSELQQGVSSRQETAYCLIWLLAFEFNHSFHGLYGSQYTQMAVSSDSLLIPVYTTASTRQTSLPMHHALLVIQQLYVM